MGILERWDRHNQETAEFHNETAPEIEQVASEVFGFKALAWLILTWVGSALLGVLLRVSGLRDSAADAARIAILFAIGVTCIVLVVVQTRRKRAEWKRGRADQHS